MANLKLKRVGTDYWSRPVYQSEIGCYYKDINIFSNETPKVLYSSCPMTDFEGEPNNPITNFEIID